MIMLIIRIRVNTDDQKNAKKIGERKKKKKKRKVDTKESKIRSKKIDSK